MDRKRILIILGAVIFIILIAGGALILSKKYTKTSSPVPSPTSTETTLPSFTGEPTASPTPSATRKPTPKPTPTPSPTPSPTPVSQSTTINSTASLDGFRSSNNGGNANADIRAGRNINLNTRGFISFDIPSSLNGKTIDKATLKIYQNKVDGNPYGLLGDLKIDHLDYGSSLTSASYSVSSLSSSFATIATTSPIEWKSVDVTDMFRDDISNTRARSQYRIHFQIESTGGDINGDFAYFESGENYFGTGNIPQLVVTYH